MDPGQPLLDAIGLLTLRMVGDPAERDQAEAAYAQAVADDGGHYAVGAMTAALVDVCEALLVTLRDDAGRDPLELLQRMAEQGAAQNAG